MPAVKTPPPKPGPTETSVSYTLTDEWLREVLGVAADWILTAITPATVASPNADDPASGHEVPSVTLRFTEPAAAPEES